MPQTAVSAVATRVEQQEQEGTGVEDNMPEKQNTTYLGLGIGMGTGLGVAIGATIGAMTDNVGFWVAIGISMGAGMGVAIGTVLSAQKKAKDE